ncbi:hypothetical protein TYRP_000459, partial [Tyrophagus putrescentiae]
SILYTAVDGGKVALPCNVQPPGIDDHVVLILWYKDEEFEPIFTIDARAKERVYFNQHNMPAFLQIDPVQVKDAGEYRCRVDFKKARTVNTVIQLKVIVPPEEPIISYRYPQSSQQHLKGLIGPFDEGKSWCCFAPHSVVSVSLTGEVSSLILSVNSALLGKPRPTLTWWKDYTVIDDTFEYKSKDVTTNELVIESLARHHLLSIFTCQASNNNITLASSASIRLDMNLKPLEVKIKQLSPFLLAGGESKFECSTFGSKPKAKLYWMFDGKRIDTTFNGDMQTISIISLPLKRQQNNHILSCYAENPKIGNSTTSDNLVLNVQYRPELSLQLGTTTLSLQSIQEGNDIYFDCVVDASPMPVGSIVWRFNEEILEPRQGIILSNYSLVLQNVRRHMSGRYQCQAGNQHGIATSNSIMLNIRYAPYCKFTATLAYGLSLFESAKLVCEVEANPMPSSFRWKFERELELSSFRSHNFSSVVLYRPNSTQHYGTIECTAKNDVGIQVIPCKYHIIDSGPPNFPFHCLLHNQSVTQVSIQCSSERHGNDVNYALNSKTAVSQTIFVHPITFYVAEVYDKSGSLVQNLTLSPPMPPNSSAFNFLIGHLAESSIYKVRIYATNSKGKSDQIWISAPTLRKAEKYIDSNTTESSLVFSTYSLSHIKWFVTSLCVFLLILLVVIVTAITYMSRLCQRIRRNSPKGNASEAVAAPEEMMAAGVSETSANYALESLGIQTVYTETNDAICNEYYSNLLATQYSPKTTEDMQLLSLDLYKINKGPPDLIPTFYFNEDGANNDILHLNS